MKRLFLDYFNVADPPVICVSGNGANNALIHLLAQEAISQGFRTLVVANTAQKYPVEGKVLVSDETDLLMNLIRADEPEVTYLAKKVEGDLLMPFTADEIKTVLKNLDGDVKVFVQNFHEGEALNKYGAVLKSALSICTVNFNLIRPRMLEIYESTSIRSSSSSQKRIKGLFVKDIAEQCPSFENAHAKAGRILFIDQVKNLLDENLLIPVARSLKDYKNTRILYGHVHHYQVKEA